MVGGLLLNIELIALQFPANSRVSCENEVLSETIFYAVHELLSRPLWRASCLQAEPPLSVGTLMVATTEHDVTVEQMLVGAFLVETGCVVYS